MAAPGPGARPLASSVGAGEPSACPEAVLPFSGAPLRPSAAFPRRTCLTRAEVDQERIHDEPGPPGHVVAPSQPRSERLETLRSNLDAYIDEIVAARPDRAAALKKEFDAAWKELGDATSALSDGGAVARALGLPDGARRRARYLGCVETTRRHGNPARAYGVAANRRPDTPFHVARTVSTGHGALRTTASATEPVSMCSQSTRPCIPITMRSMSLAVANSTIATSGCPDGAGGRHVQGSEALRRRLPNLELLPSRSTGDSSSATFVAASACRRTSSEPSRRHRSAATRSPACAGSE